MKSMSTAGTPHDASTANDEATGADDASDETPPAPPAADKPRRGRKPGQTFERHDYGAVKTEVLDADKIKLVAKAPVVGSPSKWNPYVPQVVKLAKGRGLIIRVETDLRANPKARAAILGTLTKTLAKKASAASGNSYSVRMMEDGGVAVICNGPVAKPAATSAPPAPAKAPAPPAKPKK